MEEVASAEDVLDRLAAAASDPHTPGLVTIGELMDAFGHRTWGPFLFVPAAIELSPIGAIPGVPSAIALFVLIVALQMFAGHDHLWVPARLEGRGLPADRVVKATETLRPAARFLDRHTRARFTVLTGDVAIRAAAVIISLLALTVPPLELVPFATSIPMAAVAVFGLALLVRDGLLMAAGFAAALAAAIGVTALVT